MRYVVTVTPNGNEFNCVLEIVTPTGCVTTRLNGVLNAVINEAHDIIMAEM